MELRVKYLVPMGRRGIEEYVSDMLSGTLEGKYNPLQIRQCLMILSGDIKRNMELAGQIPEISQNTEFKTTRVDMRMLSGLADYHSEKIAATYNLCLYKKLNLARYASDALTYMEKAREKWKLLCEYGSVFHDDLQFCAGLDEGLGRRGHWRTRLPELDKDIDMLRSLVSDPSGEPCQLPAMHLVGGSFSDNVPSTHMAGKKLEINLLVGEFNRFNDGVTLCYRHMNLTEGRFIEAGMERTGTGYTYAIPADYITPEWDLLIYFKALDISGQAVIWPGIYNPAYPAPYYIVKIV